MDTSSRVESLTGALIEASVVVTDGTRGIAPEDARGIARELVTGEGMPRWLQTVGSDVTFALARHQKSVWDADAGGLMCECGENLTTRIDHTIPGGLGDVVQGNVWMARHQAAVLATHLLI